MRSCPLADTDIDPKRLLTTTTNVYNLVKSLGTTVFAIQNYKMYVITKKEIGAKSRWRTLSKTHKLRMLFCLGAFS